MENYGRDGAFLADCPARLAVELIADKWVVVVLAAVSAGPVRRVELISRIGGISGKVLTQTLHRLERQGLVEHQRFAEAPPRVEYGVTELGRTLIEPIQVLADWAREHGGRVLDAVDDASPGGRSAQPPADLPRRA